MLYMGIDLHKRHLTICARDEQGRIVIRRQVSTRWSELDAFLEGVQNSTTGEGGFMVMVEVCGFERWLIERLERYGCKRVCVVAPKERVRQKTDRRDAAKLSELLWINRERVTAGERLIEVKEVYQASETERYDRQLTALRYRLGKQLTRAKNAIRGVLRRHNLEQACPTKGMFTRKAMRWLREVSLPEIDRMELDMLLVRYDVYQSQIQETEREIHQRAQQQVKRIRLLRTVGKMGEYSALAISAHVGPVDRFKRARSLPNFFGITPGCRSTGENERVGGMTKAGHPLVRFLLGQLVLHGLRSDPGLRRWYRGIKRRRGAKIARVAVMRRLCEAIWHVLSKEEGYRPVDSLRADAGEGRRGEGDGLRQAG